MKGKIIGIILIIITIGVVSVNQSIRTSDLESKTIQAAVVETSPAIQPTESVSPTVQPSTTPEASITPVATITPKATVTPEATVTPVPTASIAPAKKEAIITSASSVNIRKTASTDSEIVGKLYTGAVLTIESEKNGWSYISSGKIKGYVSSDLITVSDKIEDLKKKYAYTCALVKVKLLNVRSKASTEADIITKLETGSEHKVLSINGEWVRIALYNTEMTGYVNKEYVTVKTKELHAVSTELDQLTKQSVAAKYQELQKEKAESPATTQTPTVTKRPTQTPKPNPKPTPKTTVTPKPEESIGSSLTNSKADQLKLLACIIYCEAGYDTYEGKLAVANVVLNRVKSSAYPNTIKGVVYQKNQFSPATSGRLEAQLKKYPSYSTSMQLDCIKAAKEALAGTNNIGRRTCFRSALVVSIEEKPDAIKVGAHVFW